MGRILFVTGTDTGVGKTLFTLLSLHYLRSIGVRALGVKPFCSGGRRDAELICAIQDGDLSLAEVNPWHFRAPLAPLAAARQQRQKLGLREVVAHIRHVATRCDCLLVEGAGGLLVPVGEDWFMSDLIAALNCEVAVISANRLGTINHTLLTVRTLEKITKNHISVVLMGQRAPDASAGSNGEIIRRFLGPERVAEMLFLGDKSLAISGMKKKCKKAKKTLARVFGSGKVALAPRERGQKAARKKV